MFLKIIPLWLMLLTVNMYAQESGPYPESPSTPSAADVNNIDPINIIQENNPVDVVITQDNTIKQTDVIANAGFEATFSKYVKVYNLPLSYSFKANLFSKDKEFFNLKAVLPYISKTVKLTNNEFKGSGFGDMMVGADYINIQDALIVSGSFMVKLPTGKKENKIKGSGTLTYNVPLGNGATDYVVSAGCTYRSNELSVKGNIGYRFTGSFQMDNDFGEISFGDVIIANAGVDYKLSNKFAVITSLNVLSSQNTEVKYSGSSGNTSPGLTSFDLALGGKYYLPYNSNCVLSINIPVADKWKSSDIVNPDKPERNIRFVFKMNYEFDI